MKGGDNLMYNLIGFILMIFNEYNRVGFILMIFNEYNREIFEIIQYLRIKITA